MSVHLNSNPSIAGPAVQSTPSVTGNDIGRIVWIPGEFDDRAWRRLAACRDVDPAVFFPIGLTGEAIERIDEAKAICRGCPVRLVCLQYALATHQDDGVWGGYDEGERRELRRRWRRLGSPVRFVPGTSCAGIDGIDGIDGIGRSDWTPEAS